MIRTSCESCSDLVSGQGAVKQLVLPQSPYAYTHHAWQNTNVGTAIIRRANHTCEYLVPLRGHLHIIGNQSIENVGQSQSCMVSKLPIIWTQTVDIVIYRLSQVEFEPWNSEDEAEPERAPVRRFVRPSARLQRVRSPRPFEEPCVTETCLRVSCARYGSYQ